MRAFVAAVLPPAALDSLEGAQSAILAGRLPPRENLHLTLAFLGEQPEDTLEELHRGLEDLRLARFMAHYDGLDIFDGGKQRLLVAKVSTDASLQQLHNRIKGALHTTGLTPERRRFRPHITLARMTGSLSRTDAGRLAAYLSSGVTSVLQPFEVSEFALFRSTLRPDGARHEELARYQME